MMKTGTGLEAEEMTLDDFKTPAKVCPILMAHNFRAWAACMKDECAMWNKRNECCGLICPKTGR